MKKTLSFLLSFVMLLSCASLCAPAYAKAPPKSGKCGDSITFTYNEKAKTLTLSGKGKMYTEPKSLKPFCYKNLIKKIVVKKGITDIDNYYFKLFDGLKEVTVADSVKRIGKAFCGCHSLVKVKLPEGLEEIESNAFNSTESLKTITIPKNCVIIWWAFSESGVENAILEEGSTVIPYEAFYQTGTDYYGLKTLYMPKSIKAVWIDNIPDTTYYAGTEDDLKKIDVLSSYDDEGGDSVYNEFLTYKDLGHVYCNTSLKMKAPKVKKASKGSGSFTVKIKPVKDANGYEIQCCEDMWFRYGSESKIFIKGFKGTSKTVKKLKKGKTYYYRIRSYKTVKGKKVYSRWNVKRSIDI